MKSPKLTIELVPKSSFYSNVRSNVSRREWDKIRKKVYENAGHVCECCGGVGRRHPVEAHEVWEYTVDNRQVLKGMQSLCPSCHQVKHIGLAQIQGKYQYALAHLSSINKWTIPQSEAYVKKCFLEWGKRSKIEWELDISYLEEFVI